MKPRAKKHRTRPSGHLSRELLLGISSESIVALLAFWIGSNFPNEGMKPVAHAITILIVVLGFYFFIIRPLLRYVRFFEQFGPLCEELHALAHATRDLVVHAGRPAGIYVPPPGNPGPHCCMPDRGLMKHEAGLAKMLEVVVRIFELRKPGVKLFAALRDYRADGAYHTFLRAGSYNPSRNRSSRPLYEDKSVIVSSLRKGFMEHKCVIITGSKMGSEWWEKQENDAFGEDLSVMMGTVLTMDWAGGSNYINQKHAWILTISANEEDVFTDADVPLMQAINDHFSSAANTLRREQWLDTPPLSVPAPVAESTPASSVPNEDPASPPATPASAPVTPPVPALEKAAPIPAVPSAATAPTTGPVVRPAKKVRRGRHSRKLQAVP